MNKKILIRIALIILVIGSILFYMIKNSGGGLFNTDGNKLIRKLTLDVPAEPINDYQIPLFKKREDAINTLFHSIKPGVSTLENIHKIHAGLAGVDETEGKDLAMELYKDSIEKHKYLLFSIGNQIGDQEEESDNERYIEIAKIGYEFDANYVLQRAYFINNETTNFLLQEVFDALGKADYSYLGSTSNYEPLSEIIFCSKGITVLGKSLKDNIHSIIMYEPMSFEQYKDDYIDLTPIQKPIFDLPIYRYIDGELNVVMTQS